MDVVKEVSVNVKWMRLLVVFHIKLLGALLFGFPSPAASMSNFFENIFGSATKSPIAELVVNSTDPLLMGPDWSANLEVPIGRTWAAALNRCARC
tara:strand:- start:260 stop:544 length:285 start_codon:yes stop_codon:yes gene_type:complete